MPTGYKRYINKCNNHCKRQGKPLDDIMIGKLSNNQTFKLVNWLSSM